MLPAQARGQPPAFPGGVAFAGERNGMLINMFTVYRKIWPAGAGLFSRSCKETEVMKGMRARRYRIPTIKLDGKSGFGSKSNPNRKRKRKVTRGDVFFGAEFGGQARPRTQQFLRHRGRSGYFFWQTVRKEKNNIAREYLDAIQRVLNTLKDGA